MVKALSEREIPIALSNPVKNLIINDDHSVIGVEIEGEKTSRSRIKAKKVIQPLVDQAAGLAVSIAAYLGQSGQEVKQIVETLAYEVGKKLTREYEHNHFEYMRKFSVRRSDCWDACYDSLIC